MHYRYGLDNAYPDFYIEHSKLASGKSSMRSNHYHNCYEIYYYLGNKMCYIIDGEKIYLTKSDIFFINRNVPHKTIYSCSENEERIIIMVEPKCLDIYENSSITQIIIELFNSNKRFSLSEYASKEVNTIIQRILKYYNSNTCTGLIKAKLGLMELLLSVKELNDRKLLHEHCKDTGAASDKISDIIDYLNNYYYEKISLDLLANKFYVNKYYLCNLFKKETNCSIIQFLNKKRLNEAQKLLIYSNYSITDVSGIIGFENVNYFINIFKKQYNCTPKTFRDNKSIHQVITD